LGELKGKWKDREKRENGEKKGEEKKIAIF
jgi:hypothetical protein